jgi:serine/threonine protein kinase
VTRIGDAALARLRGLDIPAVDGSSRYRIEGELGKGGMGTVYRAHDMELGRDVAVKVVRDDVLSSATAERLLREARALARLEHPGIVPVHDVGRLSDGRAYYAMKLVRGERLDEHVKRGVTLGEVVRLFARISEAVAFAHANDVIHRDLKPQNVMVGEFGEVLVLDWGIAKVRSVVRDQGSEVRGPRSEESADSASRSPSEGDTAEGTVAGTPGYMAPEQLAGRVSEIDARTDIYALGAILRELIGALPSAPARPLKSIVARAMATVAAERYATVRELADDVARFADGLPVRAHREGLLERSRRIARRHRTAITLILAYLVMRVALLFFTGS